ncbi:hypothetical protein ACTXG6_06570 [Pseudonocardia sp. Cha107L01]|uniref:hypothetical protein n=1 Tax=Pseudonocardia sp. Cha107L01 TaxID=3457576 RepID=UPI00403E58D8
MTTRKNVLEPAKTDLELPQRPDELIDEDDKQRLEQDLEELSRSRRAVEAEVAMARSPWGD